MDPATSIITTQEEDRMLTITVNSSSNKSLLRKKEAIPRDHLVAMRESKILLTHLLGFLSTIMV